MENTKATFLNAKVIAKKDGSKPAKILMSVYYDSEPDGLATRGEVQNLWFSENIEANWRLLEHAQFGDVVELEPHIRLIYGKQRVDFTIVSVVPFEEIEKQKVGK